MKYNWLRKEHLKQKIEDVAAFIKADLEKDGIDIDQGLNDAIDKDAADFMKNSEGMEVRFWDNGETLNHMNGFVKIKNDEIVGWMPLWQS
ncbi:MAG: hypothetical protein M0R80_01000 [Proteobacteria bacterium]|jgi:hypothetical protein|nr:hypothetical protein [Pseudomonadota bacterium]